MRDMVKFIIEHLEPRISDWLLLEYRHCRKYGSLTFTNVKSAADRKRLAQLGEVYVRGARELPKKKLIVLDPSAKKTLTRADFKSRPTLVIGGIIGDDPPRKRTRAWLTSKLRGGPARNLGRDQLSIDGAACVAAAVAHGKKFEIVKNPEIKISPTHSVVLHYAVPKIRGKLVIPPGIKSHLLRRGFG